MTPAQQFPKLWARGLISVAPPLTEQEINTALTGGAKHRGIMARDKVGPPPAADFKSTPGPKQGVPYKSPYI